MRKQKRWVRLTVQALVLATVLGLVLTTVSTAWASPRTPGHGARALPAHTYTDETSEVPLIMLVTTRWSWARVEQYATSTAADSIEATVIARTMASLTSASAPANLVPRTGRQSPCLADGWLTLSAGARTVASADATCQWPQSWEQAAAASAASGYGARPGALADALASAHASTLAIGPGAVLALTDSTGRAPASAASLTSVLIRGGSSTTLSASQLPDLTIVDTTRNGVDAADRTLAADLRTLASSHVHARIMLVSVASGEDDGLQVLLMPAGTSGWDEGSGQGIVASASTHHEGLVQLTDLAPTVVAALGGTVPASMTGSALTLPRSGVYTDGLLATIGQGQDSAQLAALVDAQARTVASHQATVPAGLTLIVLSVVCVVAVAVALRGPGARGRLGACAVVALAGACLPTAAWLTSLVPWWRVGTTSGHASAATVAAGSGVMLVMAVALAACLRAGARALGRDWLAPAAAGTATVVVILGDGATGAHLGFGGLLGMDAIVAGRFYGVSNIAFALAASALVVVGAAAAYAVRSRGGRRETWAQEPSYRPALVLSGLGLAALAADGLPATGADVGGALSLVVVVFALGAEVYGVRWTWRRGAVLAGGAVACVTALAALDLATGPRTHAGRFLSQLLGGRAGDAGATIVRKVSALVTPFITEPLAVVALCVGAAGVVAGVVLVRRQVAAWREGTSAFEWARPSVPVLPAWTVPALRTLVVLVVVEVCVNDSGLIMAAYSLAAAGPLVTAMVCEHLAARAGASA